MQTVPLGSHGLTVSRQGLGCMGMSEFYGHGDDQESVATIHRALELGVTLLDTADIYGPSGTKRRRYLEENVAALDVQLSSDDLERLAQVGVGQGDRYADMSRVEG